MIRTTPAQRAAIFSKLAPHIHWLNEKIWTYLVADILDKAADQAPLLATLCGEPVACAGRLDPWFEAEPLSPRKGTPNVDNESNTKIDLSFGAIGARGTTGCGIEFDTVATNSWACFVEGKHVRRDCDFMSTYDPLRNQLERDIESLLCFQKNGHYPERLYFTLLTPRRLRENPRARLYGYRMTEYLADRNRIVEDIARCTIPPRDNYGQVYPDIRARVAVLRLNWVSYEDILEQAFGQAPVDMLDPAQIAGLETRFQEIAAELNPAAAAGGAAVEGE
jgi:hypothetical protein